MAWPAAPSSTQTSAGHDAPAFRRQQCRRQQCRRRLQSPACFLRSSAPSQHPPPAPRASPCLPLRWQPLTLVDVKELSHNTKRYRFALPHQEQELGLPLGQHISIKGTDAEGRDVMRCVCYYVVAAAMSSLLLR